MSNKAPSISTPQGGGALNGLGEKFSPDLFTGTGNFSVPIAVPPGRNGFQPELTLGYSTGNGNGAFGLGWNLSVPGISRKTSKGIPVYDDNTDVFILSGAEDLVLVKDEQTEESGVGHRRQYYRPRTEGLFARIIHHTKSNGEDYWQVNSKDGLVSYYGSPGIAENDPCVIANPQVRSHIFAWRLNKTVDPFGNEILYGYTRELVTTGVHQYDQLYLSSIRYMDYPDGEETKYMMEVLFNYQSRPDPFSEYKQGFEIRTTKRCDTIEIYTNAAGRVKTKTYDFIYLDEQEAEQLLPLNRMSMLAMVQVSGHNGDATEKMPPLTFQYSRFVPQQRDFYPVKGDDLPNTSLADPNVELVDLTGNGLPDILQMNGNVRWWRNKGNGEFDHPKFMDNAPAGLQLADPAVQMIDANGDGRADLLVNKPGLAGYFSTRFGGTWDKSSFQQYDFAPTFGLEDPEVKLVDMNGDGVTDILRNGAKMEIFLNNPTLGFYKTIGVNKKQEEDFPNVNFSDQRIRMADMTGDGMQDVVMLQGLNISYWPNMGYGRWGKKITMSNVPELPFRYNPARILLGDVDGDGLADLLYIDNGRVLLWMNRSGNSWSETIEIKGTPQTDDMDAVRLTDLLGSGVSGILWSGIGVSRAAGGQGMGMFFLDFTAGNKPYLLQEMNNHMGSITRVQYTSSVNYYLADEQNPITRWRTELPFPVLVVSTVEVTDALSLGKLTTTYSYHHGYWDGQEREFRGFGQVDQRDTETFTRYNDTSIGENGLVQSGAPFIPVSETHYTPPTETRTWFHQGPLGDAYSGWYEADYSDQYWQGDKTYLQRNEATTNLLKSLPPLARRDALRTLRGTVLRTELYALDNTPLQGRPYTVSESVSAVRTEFAPTNIPLTNGERAALYAFNYSSGYIFFPFGVAQRSTQWERGNEPMTSFSFTDDYDAFGQAQTAISFAVPRYKDFRKTNTYFTGNYLATRSHNTYIYKGELDSDAELLMCNRSEQAKTWDYTNTALPNALDFYKLVYDEDAGLDKTLIGHSLNYYDGDAYEGLDLGELGSYGALTRSEMLMVNQAVFDQCYFGARPFLFFDDPSPYMSGNPDYPQAFQDQFVDGMGYTHRYEGGEHLYYTPTALNQYDFQESSPASHLGLVTASKDAFGNQTTISYDDYFFLPVTVTDAPGMSTTADYDYRVLQPSQITDPNNNKSVFDFSELGLLRATALIGKGEEGDYKGAGSGFYEMYEPSTRLEYDFFSFVNNGDPVWVKTTKREYHYVQDINNNTIVSVQYSDGFGRLLQTRTQAEDTIYYTDTDNSWCGDSGLPADQSATNEDAIGHTRDSGDPLNVVVSGWQVYNNKGKVVEKYEPFFDSGFDYKSPVTLSGVEASPKGVKITMYYDPRGQVVRTVNPDGSEQRVIFGVPIALSAVTLSETEAPYTPTPWETYTYDAEDLDPDSPHYATPKSAITDAMGRTIQTMDRLESSSSTSANVQMRYEYDIRGNLRKVWNAYDLQIFQYGYDLRPPAKEGESIPPLYEWNRFKGSTTLICDSMGRVVTSAAETGAFKLSAYDALSRPTDMWAKDKTATGVVPTLRQHLVYGDDDAANVNTKGKLYEQYDEAGYQLLDSYDFKGNLLHKYRRVIQDGLLLDSVVNSGGTWSIDCYRVDWTLDSGQTWAERVDALCESQQYDTNTSYDALNRPMQVKYPIHVGGGTDDRKILTPTYNKAGALLSVNMDGTDYVKEIAYNAKGQRLLVAFGNGMMTRYVYDAQTFRLARLKTEAYDYTPPPGGGAGGGAYEPQSGTTRQDFAYTYDQVGNILSINNETPACGIGGTDTLLREFDYDALYRLLSGTGRENQPTGTLWNDQARANTANTTQGYTQNYSYNLMGDIVRLQHVAQDSANSFTRDYGYSTWLTNMDIGSTSYPFSWDEGGNLLTEDTTRHFEWDHSYQMRCFYNQAGSSQPSVFAAYLYAGGTRVKKLVRTSGGDYLSITYIDGIFEYQTDGTDEQNTLQIMDDQTRIASVRIGDSMDDDTPAVKYILTDHLGSSNVLLDDDGSLVSREEYYPFGETSFGSYAKKRYRYCGKEKDGESGLYYYGMRYYAPWTCRFVSVDPLAAKYPFYTPYQYAGNKPINATDLDGAEEKPVTDTGGQASETTGGASNNPWSPIHYDVETIKNVSGFKIGDTYTDILGNNYNYSEFGWETSDQPVVTGLRSTTVYINFNNSYHWFSKANPEGYQNRKDFIKYLDSIFTQNGIKLSFKDVDSAPDYETFSRDLNLSFSEADPGGLENQQDAGITGRWNETEFNSFIRSIFFRGNFNPISREFDQTPDMRNLANTGAHELLHQIFKKIALEMGISVAELSAKFNLQLNEHEHSDNSPLNLNWGYYSRKGAVPTSNDKVSFTDSEKILPSHLQLIKRWLKQ